MNVISNVENDVEKYSVVIRSLNGEFEFVCHKKTNNQNIRLKKNLALYFCVG